MLLPELHSGWCWNKSSRPCEICSQPSRSSWESWQMGRLNDGVRHQVHPTKAIKMQTLADFLAPHLVPDDSPLITYIHDVEVFTINTTTWELYFDGTPRGKMSQTGHHGQELSLDWHFDIPVGKYCITPFLYLRRSTQIMKLNMRLSLLVYCWHSHWISIFYMFMETHS